MSQAKSLIRAYKNVEDASQMIMKGQKYVPSEARPLPKRPPSAKKIAGPAAGVPTKGVVRPRDTDSDWKKLVEFQSRALIQKEQASQSSCLEFMNTVSITVKKIQLRFTFASFFSIKKKAESRRKNDRAFEKLANVVARRTLATFEHLKSCSAQAQKKSCGKDFEEFLDSFEEAEKQCGAAPMLPQQSSEEKQKNFVPFLQEKNEISAKLKTFERRILSAKEKETQKEKEAPPGPSQQARKPLTSTLKTIEENQMARKAKLNEIKLRHEEKKRLSKQQAIELEEQQLKLEKQAKAKEAAMLRELQSKELREAEERKKALNDRLSLTLKFRRSKLLKKCFLAFENLKNENFEKEKKIKTSSAVCFLKRMRNFVGMRVKERRYIEGLKLQIFNERSKKIIFHAFRQTAMKAIQDQRNLLKLHRQRIFFSMIRESNLRSKISALESCKILQMKKKERIEQAFFERLKSNFEEIRDEEAKEAEEARVREEIATKVGGWLKEFRSK